MTSNKDCFVGIDLGTSGCRAIAIDRQCERLAESSVALPPSRRPEDGHSEQNPLDWWDGVCRVIGELLRQRPGQMRGLCIDGTSSSLLLCNDSGDPLGPALMYDDRRAATESELVADVAPSDSAARGAGSALSKLLYLYSRGEAAKARHALHQADWISAKFSGRFGFSDENNALKLGYDVVTRTWPQWMEKLTLPRRLFPQVQPVGTPLGTVQSATAAALGLPRDLKIIAGTTDSNAAVIATGCNKQADAVSSLGSTLVLKILADRPVFAAEFGVYSHRIGDQWLVGGASNTGGAVLRKHFSDEELLSLTPLLQTQRLLGLDYYPLNTPGERFPISDPSMQPKMTPVPEHRAEFLQAILEGIASIEADGYVKLNALGAPYPERVLTAGGGAINQPWRKIRQSLLGVPVVKAEHTEAAYGAALLALRND